MKTIDLLRETYTALTANKVRSGLTMLGIIIGISSVIAMVALGNGAQASIQQSIQSIGSNLLIITPGAQRSFGGPMAARGSAQTLTVADALAIKAGVSNIDDVALDVSSRGQVTAKGTNSNTSITGTSPSYATVRNVTIDEGNFLSDSNIASASKVAVIGPTTRDDLFGVGSEGLGQTIKIKGVEFKVIGITKSKGGSGFTNSDDVIYIPYTTAQHYLTGNEYLTEIDVSGISADVTTQIQTDTTALLLARHNIKNSTQVIGVILGTAIAFAVSSLGIIQAQVSISSVLLAFGVSAAIGIIFGWYPATRAAAMSPIDALRFE